MSVFSSEKDSSSFGEVSLAAPGFQPPLFVERSYGGRGGTCFVVNAQSSRLYKAIVTATDEAGNIGSAECTMYINSESANDDAIYLQSAVRFEMSATSGRVFSSD